LRSRKFEIIIPVFLGCLSSMVICAFLMMQHSRLRVHVLEELEFPSVIEEDFAEQERLDFFMHAGLGRRDFIMEAYRNPETRSRVVDFFTEVCVSEEIAKVILENAELFDIPPALAVALAWEESRLNPRAVNTKNRDESIDRGLFQLNSRSFPRLEIQSFFNLNVNAKYGMSHLRYCIDTGGSEIAALAMYNAGSVRVKSTGTPKSTLDYASRIMENRWKIEDLFQEREVRFQTPPEIIINPEFAEAEPERPRLLPLRPLANSK